MVFIPFSPSGKAQPKPNEEVMNRNFVPFNQNTKDRLDLGTNDAPVGNQNEQGIFDGSTYKPAPAGQSMNDVPENQDLYNSIGEETLGGFGPRIQRTTNDQGEQRTFFVPRPAQSEQGVLGSTRRAVEGGVLEATKGTLGFGEWMMDTLMKSGSQTVQNEDGTATTIPAIGPAGMMGDSLKSLAQFADGLLNTKFSDADKNWIDENFPTLPAQNDAEKIAQEIISVVVGAGVGGSSAGTLGRGIGSIGKRIAEIGTDFFRRAKGTDLANATQKTEVFIKELTKELLGTNVGATVTTPTDVESLSGNLLPDQIGNLSEDETNKVGHLLDNTIISGIFNAVGIPLAKGLGAVGRKFFGAGEKSVGGNAAQTTAETLFKQIDPGLEGVSPEEFKRRALAFSDMVSTNAEGDLGSLGSFTRGPVTATVKGAPEYVDEAYGYLKRTMSPQEWENFKQSHAAIITDNITSLRNDNRSNTIVQTADSILSNKAGTILDTEIGNLGGLETINKAGTTLANEVASRAKSASDMVNLPQAQSRIAAGELDATIQKDEILSRIRDAKQNNILGQTESERLRLNALTDDQLWNNWEQSYKHYNQLFDEVPNDPIGYDTAMEIAQAIADAGDEQSLTEITRIAGAGNPIKPLPEVDPAKILSGEAEDPLAELAASWSGMSLKEIFNEVRPFLSNTLNNIDRSGQIGVDKTGIIDLKKFIDDITLNSTDPRFKAAMDAYKDHMSVFAGIDSLANYNKAAQDVLQSGGRIGQNQLSSDAYNGLKNALYNTSGNDRELISWLTALQTGNPNDVSSEVADILISTAINKLGATGTDITSQELISAIQPILPTLEVVSKDAIDAWGKAVEALRVAEMGSNSAKEALATAKAEATILKANAEKRAAFNFLTDIGEDGVIGVKASGDIQEAMNAIFRSDTSTRDLINQAIDNGDPVVLRGIQAQYLTYLKNRLFTSARMSADGTGSTVRSSSGAQLDKFLEGSNTIDLNVLRDVFRDNPQKASDIQLLLEEMQLDFMSRNTKPLTFGSNTSIDQTRRRVLNTLITATMGTLNRTAATTRNIVGNLTGAMEQSERAQFEKLFASLLVDSDLLTNTLNSLGDRPTANAFEDAGYMLMQLVNSENYAGGAVRGGATSIGDRIVNTDTRTEDAQNTPDLDTQTNNAFGNPIVVDGAGSYNNERRTGE